MRPPGGLLSAVGLLTRWPVPGDGSGISGVAWFPLIGALIGLFGGGVYWLARLALPPVLSSVIAVTGILAFTGALHEDGLADYFDALGSTKGAHEALEIMRDPRVGAFGALALIVSTVWRIAVLAALEPGPALAALAMAHSLSRSAAAALVGAAPARSEGLGRFAADTTSTGGVVVSILGGLVVGTVAGGVWVAPATLVAALVVLHFRRSARRRLGGVTGDVLGACEQTVEIAVMTIAVVAARLGSIYGYGFL